MFKKNTWILLLSIVLTVNGSTDDVITIDGNVSGLQLVQLGPPVIDSTTTYTISTGSTPGAREIVFVAYNSYIPPGITVQVTLGSPKEGGVSNGNQTLTTSISTTPLISNLPSSTDFSKAQIVYSLVADKNASIGGGSVGVQYIIQSS